MSFFVSSRSNFPGQYRVFEGCGPAALCLGLPFWVSADASRRIAVSQSAAVPFIRYPSLSMPLHRFPICRERTEIGGQFALEIYRFAGRWVYEPE